VIAAADLIYPTGELRPVWFAGEDLAANLALWLTQGYGTATESGIDAEGDRDAIARAYGYWRAYNAKYLAMGAGPGSVTISGEIGVSGFKPDYFRDRAAFWKGEYTAALESAVAEETGIPTEPIRQSVATVNLFRW
jgi:hypothetical protein